MLQSSRWHSRGLKVPQGRKGLQGPKELSGPPVPRDHRVRLAQSEHLALSVHPGLRDRKVLAAPRVLKDPLALTEPLEQWVSKGRRVQLAYRVAKANLGRLARQVQRGLKVLQGHKELKVHLAPTEQQAP